MESLALEVFSEAMARREESLLCYGAKCQVPRNCPRGVFSREAVEILQVVSFFWLALLAQRRGYGFVARWYGTKGSLGVLIQLVI